MGEAIKLRNTMEIDRVVLIGFMGTGKSAVGKLLAEKLNWQFIDLDEEIVKETGCEIKVIFEQRGEAYFRKVEADLMQRVSLKNEVVVATGGGTAVSVPQFVKVDGTFVVYLQTSFSRLCERLKGDVTRPLFRDFDTVSQLYISREPRYLEIADYKIDGTNMTPDEVVSNIYEDLKGKL